MRLRRINGTKYKRYKVASSLIIVCLTGSGIFLYLANNKTNQLPDYIKSSASFPIYYPARMPDNYHLDTSSIKYEGNLMLYKLDKASSKDTITVSSQEVPESFSAKTYFYNQVPEATTLPIGELYKISTTTQDRYMIITNDHLLVLITSNTKNADDLIQKMVANLKLVK
jgi:hypothetical protein